MKFKLYRASGEDCPDEIELNTIEELVKFAEENDEIIVEVRRASGPTITIYDDYIE